MRMLTISLIAATLMGSAAAAQENAPTSADLPVLTNDEACRVLGQEKRPLPAWARMLAGPLPKTTVAMLDLDYLHRAKTPLEPILAAKLRWTAAHMLGSVYGQRYAEADLRRLGLNEDDLKKLGNPDEDICLKFGRKMTRSASSVTDEEMADLLKRFGPEKVVAMVHTVAYANFHNRIIIGLGVEVVEPDGPLPPLQPSSTLRIVRRSSHRSGPRSRRVRFCMHCRAFSSIGASKPLRVWRKLSISRRDANRGSRRRTPPASRSCRLQPNNKLRKLSG